MAACNCMFEKDRELCASMMANVDDGVFGDYADRSRQQQSSGVGIRYLANRKSDYAQATSEGMKLICRAIKDKQPPDGRRRREVEGMEEVEEGGGRGELRSKERTGWLVDKGVWV